MHVESSANSAGGRGPAAPAPGEFVIRRPSTNRRVLAVRDGGLSWRGDRVATEEPMEIRAHGPGQDAAPVAVTMRTPGADFELAVGFLRTEGLITPGSAVARVRYCTDVSKEEQWYNVVTVELDGPFEAAGAARRFLTNSSCGICGKASLDEVAVACDPLGSGPFVPTRVIAALPGRLREGQAVFAQTGGLHAAGLFSPTGELLALREDVGRHNAVDKLVGWALLAGRLPLCDTVLMVSGRASFEIVQKAAVAGIGMVCAVSAPSSLAVDAGERLGVTVVGFVRERSCNVYSRAERVLTDRPAASG